MFSAIYHCFPATRHKMSRQDMLMKTDESNFYSFQNNPSNFLVSRKNDVHLESKRQITQKFIVFFLEISTTVIQTTAQSQLWVRSLYWRLFSAWRTFSFSSEF